jgi:hypothetical protein
MWKVKLDMKADNLGPSWVARCECQPHTMDEFEEAVAQSKISGRKEKAFHYKIKHG